MTNSLNSQLGKIDFEKRNVTYLMDNQEKFVLEIKDDLIQEIFINMVQNLNYFTIENMRRNILVILSITGLNDNKIKEVYKNYLEDLKIKDEKAKLNAIKHALESIFTCFYIHERMFIPVCMHEKIIYIIKFFLIKSKQIEKFDKEIIWQTNDMYNVLIKIKSNLNNIDPNSLEENIFKIFNYIL